MADTPQSSPPSAPADTAAEFAHVTQEMYKQNLELAQRNKTLSLLRHIDEIVLSTVTDTKEIAQQVATSIVSEEDFNMLLIFWYNAAEGAMQLLAMSQLDFAHDDHLDIPSTFEKISLPISLQNNPLVRAFNEKQLYVVHQLSDIVSPVIDQEKVQQIQEFMKIQSLLMYPLIVRSEAIGVMVLGIGESETSLSAYQKDLISRLVGVIGIAIDNALLYQKIQESNERLKQIDKLKDEFVSLASHELRTPMTVIKSYLWMVLQGKQGPLNEQQKLYLGRAFSSTDGLIRLVNDMLNVSRIESGRLSMEMQDVDIINLVKTTVEELIPEAEKKELALTFKQESSDVPKTLNIDPERIKQILINLIGNSIKFTQEKGKIDVILSVEQNKVVIKVADNGIGISKENLQKLFQKFGLLRESYQKSDAQGTGLGLYICKSIVELHGGEISVDSEGIGKGTVFSFTLPIQKT